MATGGCASWRSLHLQALARSALKNSRIWNLDITNAALVADTLRGEVYVPAPEKRGFSKAPEYEMCDARVAFYDTPPTNTWNSAPLSAYMGFCIAASSPDHRTYFTREETPRGPGALTANIHDTRGCGAAGVMEVLRKNPPRRLGALKVHERAFAHVAAGLAQRRISR